MGVGGVWACRWRELRPMSFGGGGRAERGGAGGSGVGERGGGREVRGEGGGAGDGEEGYEMGGEGRGGEGREKGRGRDGGGLYEMVGMK